MKINKLLMDTVTMPTAQTARNFTIVGEKGATFEIIALEAGTLKFYDFRDRSFALGHNDIHNNLKVTLGTSSYSNSIIFPSGGGDYVIKLIVTGDTVVRNSGSNIITKNISKQSSDATVTFQPGATIAAYESLTATALTETSAGPETATDIVTFNWDVENQNDEDDFSYGIRISEGTATTIAQSYWYFQTTENVSNNPEGTGEDTFEITVASLTNLAVGMELKYHKAAIVPTNKAGSVCGTTRINNIDTDNKIISFATETGNGIAFENSQTMTFRAYGVDSIEKATGLQLEISPVEYNAQTLTTTVRATVSDSTTVTLGATVGIGGGNNFRYIGEGVDNSGVNAITSVTADPDGTDGNGAMVVQRAQNLAAGTVLTFDGTHKLINFIGTIDIRKYPSADTTINLDLDKIITVGVSGA